MQAAIKSHLHTVAVGRGYDSPLSIASYTDSKVIAWAAEAEIYTDWRDAVYEYAISVLTQIENQEIEPPALQDFINDMPVAPW